MWRGGKKTGKKTSWKGVGGGEKKERLYNGSADESHMVVKVEVKGHHAIY